MSSDNQTTKSADDMPEIWARFLLIGHGRGYKLWHEMTLKEQNDFRYLALDMRKDDPSNDQGRR